MAVVWQVRCDARRVILVSEVPATPVLVSTDARRVRQVLDGLAENALRLLGPGQPLVLHLGIENLGVEKCVVEDLGADGVAVPSRSAVLQIRDGGPGLAPEDYPVVFERGALHERYRGRRPTGAGLGLALARSLVGRLGGTIVASPAAEGGVAMTIRLPAG